MSIKIKYFRSFLCKSQYIEIFFKNPFTNHEKYDILNDGLRLCPVYGIAPFERLTLAWLLHFTRTRLGFTD